MRILLLAAALLGLGACSTPDGVLKGTMPFEVYRSEGQAPRLGEPGVRVGQSSGDAPHFYVGFERDGDTIGAPKWVTWRLPLGDYCRNRDTRVDVLLIGPTGQVWHGRAVNVRAGPDQYGASVNGFADGKTPDVLQALALGGRFTLVLENNEGERWGETVIDSLTPAVRERMFQANLKALRAIDPATVPVRSDMLMVVEGTPPPPLPPIRPCP